MGKLVNEPVAAAEAPILPPRRLRRRAVPTPLDAVIDPNTVFAVKKPRHFDPTDIYSVMPQPTSAKAAELLAEKRRKQRLEIEAGQGLPPIVLGENVPRTFVNFAAVGPEPASPLRTAPQATLRGTNWFAPDCQKETLLPTPREHAAVPREAKTTAKPLPAADDGAAMANTEPPKTLQADKAVASGSVPRSSTAAPQQQHHPRSPLRQTRKPPVPKRHSSFKDKVKAFFKTGACHTDMTRQPGEKHASQRYVSREPSNLTRRPVQPMIPIVQVPALRNTSRVEQRALNLDEGELRQNTGRTESRAPPSMTHTSPMIRGSPANNTPLARQSSFSDKVKDFMRGPTSDTPQKASATGTPKKETPSKPFDAAVGSFAHTRNPLLPPSPLRKSPDGATSQPQARHATRPQNNEAPPRQHQQPIAGVRFADSSKPHLPRLANNDRDAFARRDHIQPSDEPVRRPLLQDDLNAFAGTQHDPAPPAPAITTTETPVGMPSEHMAANFARQYHGAEKQQYDDLAFARREHVSG